MLIAGTVDLIVLMSALAQRRPVFHSEADFQFAFAQGVMAADPSVEIRLEARQAADRAEYVDLVCWNRNRRTLIEFKYATAKWIGYDTSGERFHLRNHAAYDLARRYFIHDIHRLEQFTGTQTNADGVAIMLTNEPGLWSDTGHQDARDIHFRIHEGRTLAGKLKWGGDNSSQYDQALDGTYTAHWHDYSDLDGRKGRFRWVALPVATQGRCVGGNDVMNCNA